ncbi:ArdC-like ssDNA-binding domain-containing protein [Listeria seeligeri]|uniref:ArdC-like ssDNA-binding domain-containing protein n=1 Tax=Listeria seeligeri TaxID=1640 RepID=UPI001623E756|nr:ArdC-like ssDNA-binding domain-containing protein [Listeria seeligeri]MBC1817169.1 ImmA/IrrE family metallo-endopeptidase [Listeria seeligeri]
MAYKRKTKEELKQEANDVMGKMNEAIKGYSIDKNKVKELLDFMSTFHKYSANNQLLIQTQYPGASCVASYKQFKERGFHVNKGETGIRIFRPNNVTLFQTKSNEWKQISEASTEDKRRIQSGEAKTRTIQNFKLTSVFDISQTNAKAEDVPDLLPNKPEKFDTEENIEILNAALLELSEEKGIPVYSFDEVKGLDIKLGAAKGAYIQLKNGTQMIVIKPDSSTTDYTHTLIHELAHASMHHGKDNEKFTTAEKEYQAEMGAYVVSRHYGMDTWSFSESYIANWTKNGKELSDANELLKEVGQFSHTFIQEVDEKREKIIEREEEKEANLSY